MTKTDEYFTFFYKNLRFSVLNKSQPMILVKITTKTPRNLSITVGFGECVLFLCYLFISSTNSLFLAVSSTQAGLKPLLIALRTDFIFDQAAQ